MGTIRLQSNGVDFDHDRNRAPGFDRATLWIDQIAVAFGLGLVPRRNRVTMTLETGSVTALANALKTLEKAFDGLPDYTPQVDLEAIGAVLQQVAGRMHDNYPYPHPMYAGQMLKPPHPVARMAYALAMWINPNNHALDGGRASSAMEKEAVAAIAQMFGYGETYIGHLTTSGTIANLEALWVGGQIRPGELTVASSQAHYTHARICGVLALPFASVEVDDDARMDLNALEHLLKKGGVGTVVATLGTTGVGAVDPLHDILGLRERYGFRVHVDSAYGGYFALSDQLSHNAARAFGSLSGADSIVVDPHKHGLQPYGCGCVVFADPAVGAIYRHDSPYTYFTSSELHLGEISLECSRAGASAVALWATAQLMPLTKGGVFSNDLNKSLRAARRFAQRLADDPRERLLLVPELDIVVWAPDAGSATAMSQLSLAIFDAAAQQGLHLATMKLPAALAARHWPDVEMDDDTVTCLRSCLMKPQHDDWLTRIWDAYQAARQH
jgi:glutamate/tyrosine decarboxylase-like PLP-dependent enzyme